jgi:protease I
MSKVACLVGPEFEDSELAVPLKKLEEAGHQVEVIGVHGGEQVAGKRGESKVMVSAGVHERRPDQYDALLIPGGRSPANLRGHHQVVQFVREFGGSGRPIAAICHGPQLLIAAGLVDGVRMTSGPSVMAELRKAGAEVVDQEVVEDGPFITSRSPDDLDAFSRALIDRLHQGEQLERAPETGMSRSPSPGR